MIEQELEEIESINTETTPPTTYAATEDVEILVEELPAFELALVQGHGDR